MPGDRRKKGRGPRASGERDRRSPVSAVFSVPGRVKRLRSEQLQALTDSFGSWYHQATGPKIRRARGRMWLTYLVLRFTGAKLGEVHAIDERRDLDLEGGVVKLGAGPKGRQERTVQLPPDVVEEIRSYLEDAPSRPTRGGIFNLDPGFVRRKLYERAEACGLPRDLVSPQVLRASRTIELLEGGVPLPAVQQILGLQTASLPAAYLEYEPGDVEDIFEAYLLAELRTRTSARNLFSGWVDRITRGKVISEVTVATPGGHRLVSVITNTSLKNLGLRRGSPIIALVKAPHVMVARDKALPVSSARNALPGSVTAIHADELVAEIIVTLREDTEVCSLITASSAKSLALRLGDDVVAFFDASAVILTLASPERMRSR